MFQRVLPGTEESGEPRVTEQRLRVHEDGQSHPPEHLATSLVLEQSTAALVKEDSEGIRDCEQVPTGPTRIGLPREPDRESEAIS